MAHKCRKRKYKFLSVTNLKKHNVIFFIRGWTNKNMPWTNILLKKNAKLSQRKVNRKATPETYSLKILVLFNNTFLKYTFLKV